jgi:acetyltransferase-like isoleucine patch superfamily enzyme
VSAPAQLRQWVKARRHPVADLTYRLAIAVRGWSCPVVPGLHAGLYHARLIVRSSAQGFVRAVWTTPVFKARLAAPAPGLFLYGGMPLVLGPVRIKLGSHCRVSGQTTISGRAGPCEPCLDVGSNVDIGWQTTIAVGRRVSLGNNVRIAGRAFLAGYPGHPLDPAARAAGRPDTEDQVGDIVLEDDVWLATGVTVLAGVTIGRGSVIGAGSVVTRSLPAGIVAAGIPARIVRPLP